jgi:hypothetical protein
MFLFVRYLVCSNGDTVLTFDDLTSGQSIPMGYKNILWTNAYVTTKANNTSGYYTGAVSRPNTMYNYDGNPMTMKSANGRLLNLYSAAAAAAWHDNLQLTVVGYRSNVVIVTNTFTLQVFTVSYLKFIGYTGLDTIEFKTSGGTKNAAIKDVGGTHFAMDNVCLSFT